MLLVLLVLIQLIIHVLHVRELIILTIFINAKPPVQLDFSQIMEIINVVIVTQLVPHVTQLQIMTAKVVQDLCF